MNRYMKWTAVLGVIALLSGALIVTANAHIGSSHSPFNTDGPDLVSVEAESDDTADFCFDAEITDVTAGAGDFEIRGYDSDFVAANTAAGDVEEDDDDENCVEVQFDGGTGEFDLRELTVGVVENGAVEDRSGEENTAGAAALGGSTATGGAGRTAAPNLLGFETGNDSIVYTFDQNVECDDLTGTDDAENFGFYDDGNNDIRLGETIDNCDENEVEIGFTPENPDDDADRVFVANDDNGEADPDLEAYTTGPSGDVCGPDYAATGTGACAAFEALGEEIEDRPDLTDAERSDEDQWLSMFDQDIDDTAINDDFFHVYTEDGTDLSAAAAACSEEDDSNVECTMTEPAGTSLDDAADAELPLVAVERCAVEDDDADAAAGEDCSTIGAAPVANSLIASGLTDGPDLEVVNLNAAEELGEFCFDEPISDDEGADVTETEFFLLDSEGDETSTAAADLDDIEGNCISFDFDVDDINEAVAGGVEEGATEDFLENVSPPAVAGTSAAASSTTTTTTSSGTTSGGTTTDGTTTVISPQDRSVATNLSIRYDRGANAFKGTASSRVRRCRSGRLTTLKKVRPGPDRSVGSDTTNRSGDWKIRKRVRRGRFYAVVARKQFTNRTGGTTTCQRDKSKTIKV